MTTLQLSSNPSHIPAPAVTKASSAPSAQTTASDAKTRLKRIVLAEGLIGSLLILGAPFLGEHFEQFGGSKTIAVIFAVFHYVFHIAGGAILFKTGVDWGKLHQH